jgi:2-keto-4-pentenoate hydratase/2-oxohepta-3-ene-1,7-dioic acid hydratase in catechol pathway
VPQGVDESAASSCVALVTMTNDFTHRLLMKDEYANRVGPYGAKAPRPFAPVAVTPAALSDGGARNYVPGSTCR